VIPADEGGCGHYRLAWPAIALRNLGHDVTLAKPTTINSMPVMADPISGDFSVAVMGAWLEKGEFRYGVRGVTLAGNLIDLLKNIDAVCDDLSFFGSVGSPTFRVNQLTVSGS
jgi:predicted Zn-dependent protease